MLNSLMKAFSNNLILGTNSRNMMDVNSFTLSYELR